MTADAGSGMFGVVEPDSAQPSARFPLYQALWQVGRAHPERRRTPRERRRPSGVRVRQRPRRAQLGFARA
jgi:hypothetical protein